MIKMEVNDSPCLFCASACPPVQNGIGNQPPNPEGTRSSPLSEEIPEFEKKLEGFSLLKRILQIPEQDICQLLTQNRSGSLEWLCGGCVDLVKEFLEVLRQISKLEQRLVEIEDELKGRMERSKEKQEGDSSNWEQIRFDALNRGPSIVFNPQPKCEQPTPTAMDQPSAIVIEHDSSLESQLMSTSLPLTLPKEEDCELIQEFDIQLEFMDVDYNGGEYIIEENQEEDQNQTYTEGDTSSLFLDENDSVDQAQEDDNEDHDNSEKSQSENGDVEYEEAELPSSLFADENDENSEKSEDENGFEIQEQTPKRLPPILSKTVSPSGASSRYAYKCEQCPFGSTSKQRLDAHLVVHVKGSGAIPCPDCEWYILPHRMARHQSKAHRVPAQRVRKAVVKKKKVVAPPKPKPKSPPMLLLPPPPPVQVPVEVKVEPKPPVLKPAVKKKAEKPKSGYYYKCDRCPYSSSSVARYRTHEKTHEPGSPARPCPDCGVWTLPGRQLAFHQSKVHLIQGNKKKKRSPPKKVEDEEEVEEEMYSIQQEEDEEEVEVPLIPEQPQPSCSISIPLREPAIPSLFLVTADDQQVEKRWFHCPLCSFSTGNLELLEIHRQFHESAAEYEEDEHDDENNVQILGI